jgi:hypothetical protein
MNEQEKDDATEVALNMFLTALTANLALLARKESGAEKTEGAKESGPTALTEQKKRGYRDPCPWCDADLHGSGICWCGYGG